MIIFRQLIHGPNFSSKKPPIPSLSLPEVNNDSISIKSLKVNNVFIFAFSMSKTICNRYFKNVQRFIHLPLE